MKGCDHDRVYSGQINLSRRYAWICRKCGEHDWSETYELRRVDFNEYCSQRVIHGWMRPQEPLRLGKLPSPPRVPANLTMKRPWWPFVPAALFFAFLSVMCALAAIPWGALGPIMPLWVSLIASGLGLATATVLFVCWKQGLQ